jgi:hypothetical protein
MVQSDGFAKSQNLPSPSRKHSNYCAQNLTKDHFPTFYASISVKENREEENPSQALLWIVFSGA